jgi:HEAT repeat protein
MTPLVLFAALGLAQAAEESEEKRLQYILDRLPAEIRAGDEQLLIGEVRRLRDFPTQERAVDALAGLARHRLGRVALGAIRALGEVRHPRGVPPLLALARELDDEKKKELAAMTVWALGECRDARAHPVRVKKLSSRETAVAAEALGKSTAKRRAAAEALLKEYEALSASYQSSRETTLQKRYEALSGPLLQAFGALAGRSFSGNVTELRTWFNENGSKIKDEKPGQ